MKFPNKMAAMIFNNYPVSEYLINESCYYLLTSSKWIYICLFLQYMHDNAVFERTLQITANSQDSVVEPPKKQDSRENI